MINVVLYTADSGVRAQGETSITSVSIFQSHKPSEHLQMWHLV